MRNVHPIRCNLRSPLEVSASAIFEGNSSPLSSVATARAKRFFWKSERVEEVSLILSPFIVVCSRLRKIYLFIGWIPLPHGPDILSYPF